MLYLALWLYDDYMGLLMSIVMAGIFLAILIISLIVEKIEPSKVPRWYFQMMLASIIAPLLVGLFFLWTLDGDLLSIFEY